MPWVIQDRWTFSIRACVSLSPLFTFSRHDIPLLAFQMDSADLYPPHFQPLVHFGLVIFHSHFSLSSPLCVFYIRLAPHPQTMMEIANEPAEQFPSSGNMFWYAVWAEEAREAPKTHTFGCGKTFDDDEVRATETVLSHRLFLRVYWMSMNCDYVWTWCKLWCVFQ